MQNQSTADITRRRPLYRLLRLAPGDPEIVQFGQTTSPSLAACILRACARQRPDAIYTSDPVLPERTPHP
jgi:hypothetical protein